MLKKLTMYLLLCFAIFGEGEKIDLTDSTTLTNTNEKNNVTIISDVNTNYNLNEENTLKEPSFSRLINQTKAIGILSISTVGVLYLLPESFTGWDRNDLKNLGSKYGNNVKGRGIVWDPDNMFFNMVGHPYVGAVYYIAARKSGYNEFKSFTYSFVMSSLFWEMGVESMAEAPSMQDLVITPGVGALLGEYLFRVENKILKNQGKVCNSKFLGKTALLFIDPIGSLANGMGYKDDKVQGFWSVLKNDSTDNKLQLGYNLKVTY